MTRQYFTSAVTDRDLGLRLKVDKFDSLQDMVNLAMRYEAHTQVEKPRAKPVRQVKSQNEKRNGQKSTNTGPRKPRQYKCYYCGESGHAVYECTKLTLPFKPDVKPSSNGGETNSGFQ